MKPVLLFYLVRLAYVFGLSSTCYLIFWIASILWKEEYVIYPPESTSLKRRSADLSGIGVNRIWQLGLTWTLRVSVLTAVFIIGYATRDLQSYKKTVERHGDTVTERRPDSSLRMLAKTGEEFETDFCRGSIPNDLLPGERVDWTFEQKTDCKLLKKYKAETDPYTGVRLQFDVPTLRKEVSENVRR